MDGRTDRPYFIEPFPLPLGSKKPPEVVIDAYNLAFDQKWTLSKITSLKLKVRFNVDYCKVFRRPSTKAPSLHFLKSNSTIHALLGIHFFAIVKDVSKSSDPTTLLILPKDCFHFLFVFFSLVAKNVCHMVFALSTKFF